MAADYPGFEAWAWQGIVAPAGTPPAVVARLNETYRQVVAQPGIREKLTGAGIEVFQGTPAEMAAHMQAEGAKWEQVKTAGIKLTKLLLEDQFMTIETWLAFAAASAVLIVIPGPTILLVVSYALGQGWRTALPMAVGVALGDFTAMSLSFLGLGALLAASASVFTTALKWAGRPTSSGSGSSSGGRAGRSRPRRVRMRPRA